MSNATALTAALDGLTADERSAVVNFLLGYVADTVPADVWATGLAAALSLVEASA